MFFDYIPVYQVYRNSFLNVVELRANCLTDSTFDVTDSIILC
ncbi:hypothetical protein SAMN05421766_104534 [Zobellia uliginosa]|uniref:Uncharacterized protein n=1 Tax=Zobellia uliginosa TaxID=143224 RepID=A0ABY1KWQ8_9FLAO|nr:hypothetical protein SAMN05421766_104534 [Zobellia uliginosa]